MGKRSRQFESIWYRMRSYLCEDAQESVGHGACRPVASAVRLQPHSAEGQPLETYQYLIWDMGFAHNVSVPSHNPLRVGTLDDILGDVAEYLEIGQDELMQELFG